MVIRHISHKSVGIGRAELCEPAVFQYIIYHRVVRSKLLQNTGSGRIAGLGLLAPGKSHFFKEDLAQLLGRCYVKDRPGLFVNLLLQLVDPAAQLRAVFLQ